MKIDELRGWMYWTNFICHQPIPILTSSGHCGWLRQIETRVFKLETEVSSTIF